MKLILPVGDVPAQRTVTKLNGRVVHVVRDTLTVYQFDGQQQVIKAGEGTRFLVSDNGAISTIRAETEVVWEVEADEVANLIKRGTLS